MVDKNEEKQDIKEQKKPNVPVEFEKSEESKKEEEKFDQEILNG